MKPSALEVRPTTLMSNETSQKLGFPAGIASMTGDPDCVGTSCTSFGDVLVAWPDTQVTKLPLPPGTSHVVLIVPSPWYWMTGPSSVHALVAPFVPVRQSRSKLTWCTSRTVPP